MSTKRTDIALFACLLLAWSATSGCDDESSSSSCVYNSDCPEHQMCHQGTCIAECQQDRDCEGGTVCDRGACVAADVDTDADVEADGIETEVADELDESETLDLDGVDDAETGDIEREPRPVGDGTIQGTVHFRLWEDTRLPVSYAAVYWTLPNDPPDPLPSGASCECDVPPNAVMTDVDGRFRLNMVPAGPVLLVIQKGGFRRYRLVDVIANEVVEVPEETTEMPTRYDLESGDVIPTIAIGTGRFDAIEEIFAKLRMAPLMPTMAFDYHAYMDSPDAYGLDLYLYQTPRELDDNDEELLAPSFGELLSSLDSMMEYQIIFMPCAEYNTYRSLLSNPIIRENIRAYVDEGGKLYVTDYAYDNVEQVWPEYIDFRAPEGSGNADGHVGDPDYMGIAAMGTLMYWSPLKALNGFLSGWLNVIGSSLDGTFRSTGNWVNLGGVGTIEQCCDADGQPVMVTPEVVASGPNGFDPFIGDFGPSHDTWDAAQTAGANYPHTLQFPYGCGRVMYSTYHTVDFTARVADLAAQERVLLWLILEISVCDPNPIKGP